MVSAIVWMRARLFLQGGTCCGQNCYDNLMFTLAGDGALISYLNGECVTVDGASLSTEPCQAGKTSQQWSYNESTLMLSTCSSCGRGRFHPRSRSPAHCVRAQPQGASLLGRPRERSTWLCAAA